MKQKIQPNGFLDVLTPDEFIGHMTRQNETLARLLGKNAQFKRVLQTVQANAAGNYELDVTCPDGFMWDVRAVSFQSAVVPGTFTVFETTAATTQLPVLTGPVTINSVAIDNTTAGAALYWLEDAAGDRLYALNVGANNWIQMPIYSPAVFNGLTLFSSAAGTYTINYTILPDISNMYINDTSNTLNQIYSIPQGNNTFFSKQIVIHGKDVLKFAPSSPNAANANAQIQVLLWVIEVPATHEADLIL